MTVHPLQPFSQPVSVSTVASHLRPSLIGHLSQLAATLPNVLNLGEGFPDFPLHPALESALQAVATQPMHQHTHGAGLPTLRQWIAHYLPWPTDPNTDITITCGATQALSTTLFSLLNPGDEVVVLEPFYEPYLNMIRLAGGIPRLVQLHPPGWTWQADELAQAFTPNTKAVLLNSPHNPTTRVFNTVACQQLLSLASQTGCWLIHDAVYADWCADTHRMAWLGGHGYDRVVTIGSFSKSLGITGWRLGYVVAPAVLSGIVRNVHEVQTCEAPVPLQAAVVQALRQQPDMSQHRFQAVQPYREAMLALLNQLNAQVFQPEGAVYVWASLPDFGATSMQAAETLLTRNNVLAIPADTFYHTGSPGPWLRWCYLKHGLISLM
jgi:L-glutamine---4-(methylsulfanyl)-2-oxobutanoate aminotransferase